jgi:putative transposase
LWREEGLCRKPKSQTALSEAAGQSRCCIPNHVWALDFQFDQTTDRRNLKFLNIIDEFTRESLVSIVARSITHEEVQGVLADLTDARGATPQFLRSDNGSEFSATALVAWLKNNGVTNAFIEPASPWQNGKTAKRRAITASP